MFNYFILNRPKKPTASGFSLVEVLTVIGIIGIVTVIAIPNILGWLPRRALQASARGVYADMQKARLKAVKQNTSVILRFDSSTSPGFYYFDNNNSNSHDSDEERIELSTYGKGVDYLPNNTLNNWAGDANTLKTIFTFQPTGRVTVPSGTVYLKNQTNSIYYAITATTTGSLKMRYYDGTSWQ